MAVVISENLQISSYNGSVLPLSNARICYDSYLDDATITSTITPDDGYPLDNIVNDQTFERCKSPYPALPIDIDLGSAKSVDYVACVGKSLEGVYVYYSYDGIDYEQISSLLDATKTAKMLIFESVLARYWKVILSNLTDGEIDVANVKMGEALAMYRPIYGGHSPATLSRKTVLSNTISEGGEFLSSNITRQGFSGSYDYQHLPAEWYREYFDPFVSHARTGTYYIAWNPEDYPTEVIYAWSTSDIQPSNMGIRDLMQVSWSAGGYDVV